MSDIPERASAVIIGAGIVGNSLAYHLSRLGWTQLVLVDTGPMPNPGGSTGHASNFIFPIEYSKMMMELTRDSTEQYQELGVFTESGGIEVARTQSPDDRAAPPLLAGQGVGDTRGPADTRGRAKLVPYPGPLGDPRRRLLPHRRRGGLAARRDAHAGARAAARRPHRAGRHRGARHREIRGAAGLAACARRAATSRPRSARSAAASGARGSRGWPARAIPLTPIVHQMISVGPIELFDGTEGEIAYPIVRDVDENMYERQHGGDIEVGSYAHRPIIVAPDDIPSIEAAVLSPTELPFTQDDFDPQLEKALELMPELLGDERAGIRHAINGLISMTPDGHPVLGETPEVPGLWAVAASWIKEGPGIGRAVAEWMSGVTPEIDIHEADISRFYPHQRTTAHVTARATEGFNKMYGIVHPAEQWEAGRPGA